MLTGAAAAAAERGEEGATELLPEIATEGAHRVPLATPCEFVRRSGDERLPTRRLLGGAGFLLGEQLDVATLRGNDRTWSLGDELGVPREKLQDHRSSDPIGEQCSWGVEPSSQASMWKRRPTNEETHSDPCSFGSAAPPRSNPRDGLRVAFAHAGQRARGQAQNVFWTMQHWVLGDKGEANFSRDSRKSGAIDVDDLLTDKAAHQARPQLQKIGKWLAAQENIEQLLTDASSSNLDLGGRHGTEPLAHWDPFVVIDFDQVWEGGSTAASQNVEPARPRNLMERPHGCSTLGMFSFQEGLECDVHDVEETPRRAALHADDSGSSSTRSSQELSVAENPDEVAVESNTLSCEDNGCCHLRPGLMCQVGDDVYKGLGKGVVLTPLITVPKASACSTRGATVRDRPDTPRSLPQSVSAGTFPDSQGTPVRMCTPLLSASLSCCTGIISALWRSTAVLTSRLC
uniref:Uncharacterized protein n=1 Tax=Noctiluca scintillans TaxID=2966 RepID=A0A7S1AT51_NOCSC|mmetsp:Transcript_58832/g.156607  ORF Transcript_58832/g.156607 Transcript_58832/m.156607 type:complete len:459 (+) Transcript_58832:185-1561(+)